MSRRAADTTRGQLVAGNAADDSTLVDEVVADFRRERPDLDKSAIETVCRLIYAGRKMERRAARVLRPFALSYTDLDVLSTLRRSGEPFELSPADLLRSAMMTSGAMTTCLDRLEQAGMIRRRVNKRDARRRRVSLTAAGRELIDEVLTTRFEDARALVSRLRKTDVRDLNRLLRAVIAADDAVSPKSPETRNKG